MSRRIAVLILLATSTAAAAASSHDDDIKLFANTMAIAKTVKESCPGVEPDDRYLEALRQRLHIEEADYGAFASNAREAAETLRRAVDQAPNRHAWCEGIFRLYGPAGRLMRGLLARSSS